MANGTPGAAGDGEDGRFSLYGLVPEHGSHVAGSQCVCAITNDNSVRSVLHLIRGRYLPGMATQEHD